MPISLIVTAVMAAVDWKKVFKNLATEAAGKGAKRLLNRLKPDEREIAAKHTIELFVEEFMGELEDKTPLSAAVEGYRDQVARLIEHAGPDVAGYLQPDVKEIDLRPIERMWAGLSLDPLPGDFKWSLVAENFARDIRAYVRRTPELRESLNTTLLEKQTEIQARLAGPDPGFDLAGYREFLRKKCGVLQLSAMHTSTYERRISLWNVFVAQSARQSVPMRDLPRELLRQLREEKHLTGKQDEAEIVRLREIHQNSPPVPVLEALSRERLIVVLGDPGAGKTSLLKFLVMRWAETEEEAPLPIWIDLKEYVEQRVGILKYLESGCASYHLDARDLDQRLRTGQAAIYLDGLDEVFDGPTRGSVIEEIAAFSALYREASVVVTSRIIGYEADRLRNSGFVHLTLEEFDDEQVEEFIVKWHDAAEDDLHEKERLKRQLESALRDSRAVRELAGNPLLLTMTAILNRTQPLPRNRVELYEQASRVLLYEWDASRSLPVDTFARQEKEALLRELAGAMQKGEGGLAGNLIDRDSLIRLFRGFLKNLGVPDPHSKAVSLANQLTERNFILCYAGANRFSFVHRTFLEYFCAAWFVDLFEKQQTLTLEQLKLEVFLPHWKDETWHEVLRLIAGMVRETKAEELIFLLMEQDGRSDKLANLALAAECLGEVRNRQAIGRTDEIVLQEIIQQGIRYDPPCLYVHWREYEEYGPTRQKFVELLALLWRGADMGDWLRSTGTFDVDYIVRKAAVQEVARGWKEDSETLPWLRDRARFDANNDTRMAAVQALALGWKEDLETLSWLKDRVRFEIDNVVVMAVVQEVARGWKEDPETLPWLKDHAKNDGHYAVRIAAAQELAYGWKDDPETLLILKDNAHRNQRHDIRRVAVQEMARGWKRDPEILPWLKDRARFDEDIAVRVAALQELARGWKNSPETLPWLKDCAHEHDDLRVTALQELARGWKNDPGILSFVTERASLDNNIGVRMAAVQELARGWRDDPETLTFIKDRARSDASHNVRIIAVHELARGWKNDLETLTLMKNRARFDEYNAVRWAAVEELARLLKNDPEVTDLFSELTSGRPRVPEISRLWTQEY